MAFAIYETLGSLTGFTTAVNELHVAELYANVVPDGQQRLLCTSFDDNICCFCCYFCADNAFVVAVACTSIIKASGLGNFVSISLAQALGIDT